MNYVAALSLPPIVMFAVFSLVEKTYSFYVNSLPEELKRRHTDDITMAQKHAYFSLITRVVSVICLNFIPLWFVAIEFVQKKQLATYWSDYIMGSIITINTSTLIWNTLIIQQTNPGSSIFFMYMFYMHIISNPQSFIYSISFLMTLFTILRITDDIYIIYPRPKLERFNRYTRTIEEYAMYLFIVLNVFNLSLYHWVATAVMLPWLYSSEIDNYQSLHVINRKNTVLPAITNTIQNQPLLLLTSDPIPVPTSHTHSHPQPHPHPQPQQ